MLGFFFQSMHVPQKVIKTLAHIGISISNKSITTATRALSVQSQSKLRELGQSLLAAYAYDNFDVDLKSYVSVVEKTSTSLKHLTSGLLFPLAHGVTTDHLKCSAELWKKSLLNAEAKEEDLPPKRTWQDLLVLHPESSSTPQTSPFLSHRNKFNSWIFLYDLCTNGPSYFHQFKPFLHEPDVIEKIPLLKTPLTPACAMDINNSTVSGNICAVVDLLAQGGVYSRDDTYFEDSGSPDLTPYVVLIHGDLGTGERLQAVQIRRSLEATPWDRFQHVVFTPGLFHLKMACADALWRCFIQPLTMREDETSLMCDVSQLRPRETGIIGSKPGFHRMHQLISHAGIVRRLDCWRVYVQKKNAQWTSLEAFAASNPTLDDLKTWADDIALEYIASSYLLYNMHQRKPSQRDMQFENALLLNKYFLLYEEITYAMNLGDIGRVETCIISWIPILKAVGKHKYATHMTNFLLDVHFVYPPGLRLVDDRTQRRRLTLMIYQDMLSDTICLSTQQERKKNGAALTGA